MKSTDEIVFALGQAQEFGPHVLHHINVHCLQIRQWLPQGVPFPETGVAVQNQTRIGQPPGQTERPRPQGAVPQVVARSFGTLGIDDTPIGRGQQSEKGRVGLGKLHLDCGVVQGSDAIGHHRIQDPSSRRHDGRVSQPLERKHDIIGRHPST